MDEETKQLTLEHDIDEDTAESGGNGDSHH